MTYATLGEIYVLYAIQDICLGTFFSYEYLESSVYYYHKWAYVDMVWLEQSRAIHIVSK